MKYKDRELVLIYNGLGLYLDKVKAQGNNTLQLELKALQDKVQKHIHEVFPKG